jgi:hypothetical protein
MAETDFPHASIIEGVRFTAQVAVPNVLQGLFRRRRTAVELATRTGTDSLAHGFMAGLKRSYGNGPLWIRVVKDEALLLFGEDAIRKVLERSPDPFAADPEPKKSGMSHFQPEALTISRNPEWADRRGFTDHVLGTGMHQLGDSVSSICVEEAERLSGTTGWDAFNAAVRRATRRIILGDGAADDDELTDMLGELMDKSNPPGGGSGELYERYTAKLDAHVAAATPGSLAGLFADAPELPHPAGQVTHWLFALGDTLAINAFRALALLAAFDEICERAIDDPALMRACLQEAMRLWPTTPMLSRELTSSIEWGAVTVPKGTQVLIVNSFNHRDKEAIPYASEFAPQEWLPGGDASERWVFNHFSHGPQGCPGTELALSVGGAMLTELLRPGIPQSLGPVIDPGKPMPYALDYFALKFEL